MAKIAQDPAYLNQTLAYGPDAAQYIRRSQYLADALESMRSGGETIRSTPELGARLLAYAITQHKLEKAERGAISAVDARRRAKSAQSIADMAPQAPITPPPAASPAPPAPSTPTPGMTPAPPPAPVTTKPLSSAALSPRDRLMLAQMVSGEARGEPPAGQQAAAAVALNRARMSGRSVADEVSRPGQFMGYNPSSKRLGESDLARILANIDPVISGAVPDPSGGADHFYNPRLADPKWGHGVAGQDIGQHRFLSLGYAGKPPGGVPAHPGPAAPQPPAMPGSDVQMTSGPVPPQFLDQPGKISDQSFQVASNGQAPAPSSPPPGSSPPSVAGAPPAVPAPQVAAGGNPSAPPRRLWQATPEQRKYVTDLLQSADPADNEKGQQLADAIAYKQTQPIQYKPVTINGLPFWAPEDPADGPPISMGVPEEARSRNRTAQDLGIPGPAGAVYNESPLGDTREISRPTVGYQATSAPGQTYREAPIPGSKEDPVAPQNMLPALKSLRDEVKPILDAAGLLRRSYNSVLVGYGQQNGSGDLAIITGLQKMIDEGVVQRGEIDNQLHAQGLQGSIEGMIGFLKSSGSFSPDVRAKIKATADAIYEQTNGNYRDRALAYKGIMERTYGPGMFDNVVPPETRAAFGWEGQAQAGSAPGAGGGQPGPAPAHGAPPAAWKGSPEQWTAIQKYRGSTAAHGTQGNPFVVMTQEQYDKLPPGAWFVDHDGTGPWPKGGH